MTLTWRLIRGIYKRGQIRHSNQDQNSNQLPRSSTHTTLPLKNNNDYCSVLTLQVITNNGRIYIIIFLNSGADDVPHWCFHTIDDDENEHIFEALGSTGHASRFHSRPVDMRTSRSKKGKIYIGRIEADVWPDTPELLEGVPMSTQAGWNCQNWVIEAIRALKNKGFLEEDDRGLSYIREKYQKKVKTYGL